MMPCGIGPDMSPWIGTMVGPGMMGRNINDGEKGGRMKRALPVFLFAVLIAVFIGWAPNVHAYENFGSNGTNDNCQECHKIFGSGTNDPEHQAHAAAANNCNDCHGGFPPQLTNCTKCHGRTQDGGGDDISAGLGRGLRQHHQGAGITRCSECHGDTTGPAGVGENIPPSFYPGPSNLNPCDGSEERFASATQSLDNDGDQFYDGNDPDCQVAAPQIDVNPASHNFGDVPVGNSRSQEFTISNTGTADLHISNGVLSNETNFAVDGSSGSSPCGELPVTITPDNNCTVIIAFSPQDAITYTATVTVSSDDPVNPSLVVDLSGNGVTGPAPGIQVSPTSVDFGVVNVGNSPATEVTISNPGTDNLIVTNIALDNTDVYELDTAAGAKPCGSTAPTINTNDNCTLEIVFTPAEDGGPFTATMTIASNAPNVNVPITGNGFLDTDGDGVGDSVDEFPNNPSKATPVAATGTGKILVDATPDTLSNVAAVAVAPDQAVSGFTFPDGLVTFQVAVAAPGDNAVVTLTFPSGQPSGSKYFKDDGSGGALVEFAGATVNTDNVVLQLTDGGSGDNDNTADAMINDPGGLATPVSSGGGGGGGGGCSVTGRGGSGFGAAAVLFLPLLAILVALRRRGARSRR